MENRRRRRWAGAKRLRRSLLHLQIDDEKREEEEEEGGEGEEGTERATTTRMTMVVFVGVVNGNRGIVISGTRRRRVLDGKPSGGR